jgi:uncharacterized protein
MSELVAFTTPATAPAWKRWLVFSPLARIIIYVACFYVADKAVYYVAEALHLVGKGIPALQEAVIGLILEILCVLLVYVVVVHVLERRKAAELTLRKLPTYGLIGFVAGFLLLSTMTGLLWLLGSYHVAGLDRNVAWLPPLLGMGIATGIVEETAFRGVLYRISEEGLGTWAALAISALAFGGAHLLNPNATLWSALAIAIEAGILLALVYNLTRSLWAIIGLHAAWNFSEGTV